MTHDATAPVPETLRALYAELCRAHTAIATFRATLLGLLPVASGTAVALVLSRDAPHDGRLLIAIGVLGVAITFGLYLYELRQIDTCKQLRNHGAWLESQLGIEAGQFGGRRGRLRLRDVYLPALAATREAAYERAECDGRRAKDQRAIRPGWVGADAAGRIVYHAVALGWVALALAGLLGLR